jgi:hypothetical protein
MICQAKAASLPLTHWCMSWCLALNLPMVLQRGAAPKLNLGCLSKAASEPISCAKVPFAKAL